MALAMLRGARLRPRAAWVGVIGAAVLLATRPRTRSCPARAPLVMAVAIPGGLLMIAWYVMVGLKLVRIAQA